ncbi:hypothetical protein AAFC00_003050 [Neodothiora populina]|uniref:N-acetyltransferase domain-containing protein n=1 Tax=Neodothiora populina TaxID=2781224 RepID=A0ABR3P939_9PEZI
MSEFISFLPPPGQALNHYNARERHAAQHKDVPEIFCDAMSVREEVFVEEQKVPLENEFDLDDPRSFHWVAYASVGTRNTEQTSAAIDGAKKEDGVVEADGSGRKGSTANKLAVGTIRLVPPPHPPHPEPESHHAIDNHEGVPKGAEPEAGPNPDVIYDGKEPYVKLGRLAVLPPFRGLGLSRLLIRAALSWISQNHEHVVPPLSPAAAEQRRLELGHDPEHNVFRGLVLIHAQTTVEKVYLSHGFVKDESMGTWFEEGIEHIGMWKRVELQPEGRRGSVQM